MEEREGREKETERGGYEKKSIGMGKEGRRMGEGRRHRKQPRKREETRGEKSVEASNLAASRSKKSRVSDLALLLCFVRYEDDIIWGAGTEWISCACGRWLHEDCAEDCVADD